MPQRTRHEKDVSNIISTLQNMVNHFKTDTDHEITDMIRIKNHEEADTRMLLHANHASQSHRSIIIRSTDTDIFIMMLYFCHILQGDLFFETGLKEKTHIIDVKCVRQQVGEKECKPLDSTHIPVSNNSEIIGRYMYCDFS